MNYTVEIARTKDGLRLLELSKNGACYVVAVWNKKNKRTEQRLAFDRLEQAQGAFLDLCKGFELDENGIQETAVDFDYSNIDKGGNIP